MFDIANICHAVIQGQHHYFVNMAGLAFIANGILT